MRLARERATRAGFTLFEVLIAFAIVALTMVAVMALFAQATSQQVERLRELRLAEFARSVLEEYSETWPDMAQSGVAAGIWHWQVNEITETPNPPSSIDSELGYFRVTARVWKSDMPEMAYEVSTLMARRLP